MNGQTIIIRHTSKILRNNPLGDPYIRDTPVYLPPSYMKSAKRFPVVYLITGFTGFGLMNLNVSAYSENIQQRLDRLIRTKKIKEMIVVMPDCITKYGGLQYVNSPETRKNKNYM